MSLVPKLHTGKNKGGNKGKRAKRRTTDGGSCCAGTILPAALRRQMATKLPQAAHLGTPTTSELLRPRDCISQLNIFVKDVVFRCNTCAHLKGGVGSPGRNLCLRKHPQK